MTCQRPSLRSRYAILVPCIGLGLYLFACMALGLVEVILRKPLPELHPLPPTSPAFPIAIGASLVLFALAGIAGVRGARHALAAHWAVVMVLVITTALKSPADPVSWVPVSKAALFAMAAALAAGAIDRRPLRLSLGLVLIFYGLIHLISYDQIAQLIPAWIPDAAIWPYFTGALMLIAGAGLVLEKAVAKMALVAAALFVSWILALHSGRLIAHPLSSFEWTFAVSALALAGVALMTIDPNPAGGPPD